jgi:1-deoxy-D-xylulose-5-phosphate synthase
MFSAMGLNYLGPVDGHNLKELESVLRLAKDMEEPVLVHVLTQKGKGCSFAEEHPEIYHGVGPFNPETGELKEVSRGFSDCFGEEICRIAEENPKVFAVTAAMTIGTGLEGFAKKFPERFQDVGIAEGHATAMSAGMAKQGMIPVFAVYSSFLQRGFDMMIHDVSLLNLHVVFCLDRAGLVGSDGETHHGIFDVSYLRTVPGMKILCPASFGELAAMLDTAVNRLSGPVALRYPRGGECGYHDVHLERECLLRSGEDVTLVAYGTMVGEMLKAAEELERRGIRADVVKLSEIDGDVFPLVRQSIEKTGRMIISEEVCAAGSLGTVLCAQAARAGISVRTALLNLGEGLVPHGTRDRLMRDFQIDAQTVVQEAIRLCVQD